MYKLTKLFASFFIMSFSSSFATDMITNENNYFNNNERKLFSRQQKVEDFASIDLTGKRSLNLSNRGLKDEDILRLSQNESSGRVININLSQNPSLTAKSIEYISKSDYLGSIRDLPQISDSCGLPSATIYVRIQNTNIPKEQVRKYDTVQGGKKYFNINYIHPITGYQISEPVDYGIKFVECDDY